MSFFQFLSNMASARAARDHAETVAIHTPTPLGLSQGAALTISPVPFILASADGALIKDAPPQHLISAVGRLSFYGLDVYRSYLAGGDGAFFQTVVKHGSTEVVESRFYQPYFELIPTTKQDWEFWLGEKDGYIGLPTVEVRPDGSDNNVLTFQRTWVQGFERIEPITFRETIVDVDDYHQYINNRMMHYGRKLGTADNGPNEYLLVAAVENQEGANIAMWLGIDIVPSDLTVYAATVDSTLQKTA